MLVTALAVVVVVFIICAPILFQQGSKPHGFYTTGMYYDEYIQGNAEGIYRFYDDGTYVEAFYCDKFPDSVHYGTYTYKNDKLTVAVDIGSFIDKKTLNYNAVMDTIDFSDSRAWKVNDDPSAPRQPYYDIYSSDSSSN